jgi:hypothetical protein
MKRLLLLTHLAAAATLTLSAAATEPKEGFVHVTLERREGTEWKALDPRVVLNAKDRIRFRFETGFSGFLYVYDKATDGETERLFPGGGADNRVEPGKSYVIPSGEGTFVIDGPAGFDITYWIVSPEPLPRIPMFDDAPKVANQPSSLIPRCKEGLVARGGSGGCLDERAGPKPAQNPGKITPKAESTLRARSIRLEKDGETRIPAPASKQAPLVYEFHVAHK